MKKFFIILLLLIVTGFFFYSRNQGNDGARSYSQKPKILFTDAHPFHSGGLFRYVMSIINSDLADQFEFAVAAPESSDIYKACKDLGITTFSCQFPGGIKELFKVFNESKHFRAILKEYVPDIIHSNGSHDRTMAVWNTFFLKNRPSLVQTFHWTKAVGKDPYHWLFYNKLIDANIFISKSAALFNTERGGLKFKNAHVIENAVDLDKFQPMPKNGVLQEQLGIPNDYFIFGSNAGLAEYKRIDLMMSALTHFPKDAKIKVIVLGREPEAWIEKAKFMGIDHFLVFPGFHEDVRDYCSLFDVGFILSTRVETSSIATREMLAMGIPIISSNYSGLKDNIDDYINGIFVEPDNIPAIYEAMNFFINMQSSELESYKKNARTKAEYAFDCKNQFKAVGELYSDLIK